MEIKALGQVAYDASFAVMTEPKAKAWATNAGSYVIEDQEMYILAVEDLRSVMSLQKELEAKRTSITGPINIVLKAINALFGRPMEYLKQAEVLLKRAMLTYSTEQERLAAEAQRQAEAAARAERERLAAIECEKQEVARKALEAAEAAAAEAHIQAQAGNAEAAEAAQKQADEAISAMHQAEAEAIESSMVSAIVTIAPTIDMPSRVAGISGRVNYSAQVDDLMELIKAVAEGKAPIECVAADMKFLNTQSRAFKKPGPLFPGVRTVAERTLAARAA